MSNPNSSRRPRKSASRKKSKTPLYLGIAAVAVCVVAIIAIVVIRGSNSNQQASDAADPTPTPTSTAANTSDTYTPPALEEGKTYFADINIANYGTVTIRLDQKSAPVTAANFVALAQSKFYDGLTFHRIIDGFMMQGGDPNGNGTGGSEHNIQGEFINNGFQNPLSHTRGTVSMARAMDPNSASSQFFIVHQDSTFLDPDYAAFGTVTAGMEVVDAICTSAKPTDGNGTIPKEAQPVITSITIRTEG